MKKLALSLVALTILISGCSTTRIIDYDPENVDQFNSTLDRIEKNTEPHVVVADHNNVLVDVWKTDIDDVEVQVWDVYITNLNLTPKCVGIVWQLMDFSFISEYPNPTYVKATKMIKIGQMVGRMWIIDGVPVAPPPSGYIYTMVVGDPHKNNKKGEECTFVREE